MVYRHKKTVNCQPSTVNRQSSGFTLIELLVVISIIAILVGAAAVSWSQAQKKARDGKRKSDLKSVQTALEIYFSENRSYPADNDAGLIVCPDGTEIAWGTQFECKGKSYINPLPLDPKGAGEYHYESLGETVNSDGNSTGVFLKYQLGAALENTNDPEYCTSIAGPNPDPDSKAVDCTAIQPETRLPILPCNPNFSEGSGLSYCVIQP